MSLLIQYLVKLSLSLAVVWLFYQFVLRRLTFYNSNRWYLLAYTLLSFYIPFINISFLFGDNNSNDLIRLIPSVHQYTIALEEASHCPVPIWSTQYDKWDFIAFALMTGAGIFLVRFIKSFVSFLRIRNRAELISSGDIDIYHVNNEIIPFSFGNAVFINRSQHTAEELEEIVRHEFVHVRQRHTIDIVWAELICILNWYNPFAWLLKRSIRQNLEFIADNKVVENGIDKKQYQYLLLKVIGNSQFSIATQFNFSSLKKRIAMMNKTKSTKRQLGRFLFLFPVIAIILFSFRKSFTDASVIRTNPVAPVLTDTIPGVKTPNSKGYYIDIKDANGNCTVVVKDKSKKEIKRIFLTEWNEKQEYYENLYGGIPPSPVHPANEINPGLKEFLERNQDVKDVGWVYNNPKENIPVQMHIMKKDGSEEKYNLENKDEVARLERKYGKLPAPPPLVPGSEKEVQVTEKSLSGVEVLAEVKEVTITEVPVEVVNADVAEVAITVYPSKKIVTTTGEVKEVTVVEKPLTKTIVTSPDLQEVVVAGSPTKRAVSTTGEIKEVTIAGKPSIAIVTNPDIKEVPVPARPSGVSTTVKSNAVAKANVAGTTITSTDQAMIGDVDIKITIKNTAKPEDLESFISKLKDKGYELTFDNKDYDDGILRNLRGTIKYKGSSSTFSFTDFDQATIIVYRDGDKVNFKIYTGKRKVTT